MNEEEFKALIEDLKGQVEATNAKNKELLGKLRESNLKNKELDFDTYNKVLEENDTLKGQLSKLTNDLGLKTKDLEKVNGLLSEKDNYLKNLTLENALNENLAKIKVKDEYKDAVKALFKQSAKVEDNNVIINDKSINDFVSEWANDAGKPFISAPQNSGSGANGGQGGQNVQKLSDLSESERIALYKTDPNKFNQLVKGL